MQWTILAAALASLARGTAPLLDAAASASDATALVQKGVEAHGLTKDDSCSDHNTEELCKKATAWGLCKGWLHNTCLSNTASCRDLKTVTQCHKAKSILGFACRGWGGSSCLSSEESCKEITDETACVFGQASLGLQCKGWDGHRCLPAKENLDTDEDKVRLERRAKAEANAKAREEARLKAEKRQRQAEAAERRKIEEGRRQQDMDEEQRLAAKEAMRQRHQARVAAMQAEEEEKQRLKAEEEAKARELAAQKAEEEAKQAALAAEQKAIDDARMKAHEEEEAKQRDEEEAARRSKFGEEVFVRVVDENGKEAEIKLRSAMKLRVLMNLAHSRLGAASDATFTLDGKALSPNDTPATLKMGEKAVINVRSAKA